MGYRALIAYVLVFAAGCSKDSRESPCEKMIEKSATCCPMTADEKKIALDACKSQKLDETQRETLACMLKTPCDEMLAGKACGGLTCKTKAANADRCAKLIAKSDECCDFTPEEEQIGRTECERAELSREQIELVDCVIATSCPDLLSGKSCGGFRCKNK
jgi:hypothetical protein